jgi:Ca2+-binding EF-hand superfamily protein
MKNFLSINLAAIAILLSCTFSFAEEEVKHICFRSVDADKDGKVTFQEFKKVFGDDRSKFDAVDLNKDGMLSHDEYHKSLGRGAT